MLLSQSVDLLQELNSSTIDDRVVFFKNPENFQLFWYYHFIQNFLGELAPFHDKWIHTMAETNKSILLEAFRWSLKTELVKIYLVYCICYQIEPYIVVQSYDSTGSEEMVRNVAKMLVSKSIVTDYGNLFPFETEREDFSKKSVVNFNTTNGVKVVSRSLWEKLRGASSYDEDTGTSRPTLLVLDDIDVMDSVRNVDMIDKNYAKINNETIGAMSKEHARIIFLGNTILWDGIVRRFVKTKSNNPFWEVFRQPLFDDNGKITWDFFTPEMVEKIKADEWPDAFLQNYQLIPKVLSGTPVFKDSDKITQIQYPYKEIEGFKLYLPPQDDIVMGIDIAEWWPKWDFSTISARNHRWQVVFQFKDRVNETILAEKLDFILSYNENGKAYLGTIIPENNVGLAFINVCKGYKWFQYLLKQRKEDAPDETLVQKYWFRTTKQSKDLIIREYRLALTSNDIWVTPELHSEIMTYQYDKDNSANAMDGYHDDLLMADMISYNAVIHEPFVVKYKEPKIDIEAMSAYQRHIYNITHQRQDDAEDE